MGHNYFAVCPAGAGIAALALVGDDPRAPAWVDRVARGLELWLGYQGNVLQNKPANFDPAGAYYEGVGYASLAMSEHLLFRLALANVLPNCRQPRLRALEKAGEFFAQTFYPTAESFFAVNFGDSGLKQNAAKTVRLLQPTGFGSDVARWYLRRVDPAPADPLSLLHPSDGPASVSTLPTSVIYLENGWAMLRDSWENDATLLAVKSGFFWNHAHADAGSFILFHAGQPLFVDSGSCGNGRKEYRGYFTQSRAHNVILFNGQGQPDEDFIRGSKFPGRVHSLLDGHGVGQRRQQGADRERGLLAVEHRHGPVEFHGDAGHDHQLQQRERQDPVPARRHRELPPRPGRDRRADERPVQEDDFVLGLPRHQCDPAAGRSRRHQGRGEQRAAGPGPFLRHAAPGDPGQQRRRHSPGDDHPFPIPGHRHGDRAEAGRQQQQGAVLRGPLGPPPGCRQQREAHGPPQGEHD